MEKISFKFLTFVFIVASVFIVYFEYRAYRVQVVQTETEVVTETDGIRHNIPLDQIVSAGVVKDGIPSIDSPKYESVRAADLYLDNDGLGLVVEVAGRARFYPFQILVWHEIVNDVFQGKKLAVTYSPLTFSGVVFERELLDQVFEFGTSGKLFNSNLLMQDRTSDSLWSQSLGKAVVGPLSGTSLVTHPSKTITWTSFKNNYGFGEVLSRNTGEVRDYTRNPYGNYLTDNTLLFPVEPKDSRFEMKKVVFGLEKENGSFAFAQDDIQKTRMINQSVGDKQILVLWDEELGTAKAFTSEIDGHKLEFSLKDGKLTDEGGSVWTGSGLATAGSSKGFRLKEIPLTNTFWFSWASSHPETQVYQLP